MRDGADRGEAIGQARAVGHQVVDGDVARRVIDLVQRAGGVLQHLHVGELWRPFGDRVVEPELAFLHQHQGRDRGDRLGHGIDTPDGILGHRPPGLDIGQPPAFVVNHAALMRDLHRHAGDMPRSDIPLHPTRDPLQPPRIHPRPIRHNHPPLLGGRAARATRNVNRNLQHRCGARIHRAPRKQPRS
ncbi:hypothetical protein GALL_425520 [mine drainage metagenome]|uniref:Uncharacterized protein n=1 Tax=mine drainage metagenome TaxID=410659 RepID=A0A1J5Q6Z9_9ZZZZ